MSKSVLDKAMTDLLQDPEFGSTEDKMRLYIIFFICTNMHDTEYRKLEAILQEIGCDLSPMPYVQRWKSIMTRSSNLTTNQYEGSGTKTVTMFSKLLTQGSSFVMEGVKNLVVKRHVSLWHDSTAIYANFPNRLFRIFQ
jgi:sec1 family domain-containing protein 1